MSQLKPYWREIVGPLLLSMVMTFSGLGSANRMATWWAVGAFALAAFFFGQAMYRLIRAAHAVAAHQRGQAPTPPPTN